MTQPPKDVTTLLQEWSRGDDQALNELLPLVYGELRKLAHHYVSREPPENTLPTTALINEAYLKLVDLRNVPWQDRAHFFRVAARLMRHILVDYARRQQAAKRGGPARPALSLDEAVSLSPARSGELLALDEALERLAALDPLKSQIVELRFFGGLTLEEVADFLGVSLPTAARHWRLAKAWLYDELTGGAR